MSYSVFRFGVHDFVLLIACRGTIVDVPALHIIHPFLDLIEIRLRFDNWIDASLKVSANLFKKSLNLPWIPIGSQNTHIIGEGLI